MAKPKGKAGTGASARIAGAVDKAGDKLAPDDRDVAGPSPDPATNLLIHDILLRSGGRILRLGLEKGLLRNRYGKSAAREIVENRSMVQTLASYAVARVATRSVPGAIVVGGGIVAKALLDRRRSRRAAERAGDRKLRKRAEQE
ncbi:hypothetical protein ETX26_00680 [Pelagerythrobacter rhizovicinus]|uniref:Uncharacterized protein n=2 Tax=Pelagerythrobacter rhizovicinus TaxID=2268576 RepID=A0A4Q2KSC7_9SPHN|nr:hypothetical protein ETX26_00680 [Pelagerythrobacter rhizovicinus]